MTHHWCLLTNGIAVNLANIETVVPDPEHAGAFQFYPPRTQRGGRPIGRPTQRPTAYIEHEGYWRGVPVDPEALARYLAAPPTTGFATDPPRAGPQEAAERPVGVSGSLGINLPPGPPGPSREA